ncbi:MAG: glutathione S-transferase family protein [Pseudomonadota bacterium]
MLKIYSFPSPNCHKVAIMLEECGIPYKSCQVDILKGEQFAPEFLAISPNNKVPALVDDEGSGVPVAIFESGAILEYLAVKSGRFLPEDKVWEIKAWLHWQVGGLGPMAGQAHHFRKFAPEKIPYAIKRYTDEVNRLYGVLDKRLKGRDFIVDEISIADFACWPWTRHHEWQGQTLSDFPDLKRWFEAIGERVAVKRAIALEAEKMAPKEAYSILYGQKADTAERVQNEKGQSS